MKTQIIFFKKLFSFLPVILCFNIALAQDKKASAKAAVEGKHFVFKVQSILPSSGPVRQVAGEGYEIRVLGDSLISHLPYFGRAYSAPISRDGGINFTSTSFAYLYKNARKGGWDVSIRPKDFNDLNEFSLHVSGKGYATLTANSNNRQAISFNGNLELVK